MLAQLCVTRWWIIKWYQLVSIYWVSAWQYWLVTCDYKLVLLGTWWYRNIELLSLSKVQSLSWVTQCGTTTGLQSACQSPSRNIINHVIQLMYLIQLILVSMRQNIWICFLEVTAARKHTGILNSKLHVILLNMKKKNTLYIQFNFLQMLVFPNVRLSMTTFYINSARNKYEYDEIKRLNFLRFISTQMM